MISLRRAAPWFATGVPVLLLVLLATPAHARLDVRVKPGDTLGGIAAAHGVSTADLARANSIANPNLIVAGTVLVIPGSAAATYVVEPGDTLGGIAASFGVTVAELAAANGIRDPNKIRVGQHLSVESDRANPTAAPSSQPSSVSSDEVRGLIVDTAARYGWRPFVPLGLAMQESGWNNSVVSSAGAVGIMQVLPSTGEWTGRWLVGRSLDLTNPADNVEAGIAYLDYLYRRFDRDVDVALAAYYEGPARVAANGPSASARRYVANVLALADRHR